MPKILKEQGDGKEAAISGKQEESGQTDARSNSAIHLQLANQELYVPINHWTFLIVFVFILAWVGIEISSQKPGSLTQSVIFALTKVDPTTKRVDIAQIKGFIYEFWTPSVETQQSFKPKEAWKDMDKQKQRWYILDDGDETLKKFGQNLMDFGATGYTYYESYGRGTSVFKKGLSWVVTFPQSSEMTPTAFTKLYNRYFHRDKNIYLKISGSDATRASRGGPKGDLILTHEAISTDNKKN